MNEDPRAVAQDAAFPMSYFDRCLVLGYWSARVSGLTQKEARDLWRTHTPDTTRREYGLVTQFDDLTFIGAMIEIEHKVVTSPFYDPKCDRIIPVHVERRYSDLDEKSN